VPSTPHWRCTGGLDRQFVDVLPQLLAASDGTPLRACCCCAVGSPGVRVRCAGAGGTECGDHAVAMFAGDGTAIVVLLSLSPAAPPLFLPAQVSSATAGKLVGWRRDLELRTAAGAGTVILDEAGRVLRVALSGVSLRVGRCLFEEYVGHFVGMIAAGQALEPPSPVATRPHTGDATTPALGR
jgi:hypothetical protein